jgi:hypothetical protein
LEAVGCRQGDVLRGAAVFTHSEKPCVAELSLSLWISEAALWE